MKKYKIECLRSDEANLLDSKTREELYSYELLYNTLLYEKENPEKRQKIEKWNEELQEFRKTHSKFENNYIDLQRLFFDVMAKKVERATTFEEVYSIFEDLKFMKDSIPTITNCHGKNVTNSQLRISSFRNTVRNKIAKLQEKDNSSILSTKDIILEDIYPKSNGETPNDGDGLDRD